MISVPVRDALTARCILERAEEGEGSPKIRELAKRLFNSIFERLTPDQRTEYEKLVAQARTDELDSLIAGTASLHGPH
jgi:hypothetical protein